MSIIARFAITSGVTSSMGLKHSKQHWPIVIMIRVQIKFIFWLQHWSTSASKTLLRVRVDIGLDANRRSFNCFMFYEVQTRTDILIPCRWKSQHMTDWTAQHWSSSATLWHTAAAFVKKYFSICAHVCCSLTSAFSCKSQRLAIVAFRFTPLGTYWSLSL